MGYPYPRLLDARDEVNIISTKHSHILHQYLDDWVVSTHSHPKHNQLTMVTEAGASPYSKC